ncbi:MAG: hypothetical protein LBH96_03705 [Candidatus Peribacteria bacterium]|jgi:DNA-dependent RNA polymerase auxiliary subunit epsilon|nr:hypothetical protein [Candidatus Peribacteria bacterium]
MAYRNADGQHLIDFGKDNKLVYHPRYFNKKNKEIYLTLQEIHAKEEKKREEKKREKEINSVPYEDAASSLYIEMLSKDNVLEVIKNIWREKYQINNVEKKLNEGTFEFEKYNEKSKRRYPIALPHPVETICCIEDFLPIIKEKIKKTIQSIIKNEIRWHDELPDDNKQKFISYLKSKKYTLEQIAGLEEPKILQSFLLESER